MRDHPIFLRLLLMACVAILFWPRGVAGQTLPPPPVASILEGERIEALERVVAGLQSEVELLRGQLASPVACDGCDAGAGQPSHYVTYDNGWTIRPRNPSRHPFELRFNVHNQFRYTVFGNSSGEFIDAAGNRNLIRPRNDFDVNRGRFVFSGYAFDPNLTFYTNFDYNTVANNPMLLLLSWMSYRFGDRLTVYMGLGKVPGTWEWQESSRFTQGAERSLATTFFRPSITAGIWAKGKLGEDSYYETMIGDGFNTFTLRASQLDTKLMYSAMTWWEPTGEFGTGFSDLECHDRLAIRLGHGLTHAGNDADPRGDPGPEQTVIRLSDGTRLVEPGALAPGVQVNSFDINLYAIHLGLKRRGVSLSVEYFFRWLTALRANGAIPFKTIYDHGFTAQGGAFVIPKRLEGFLAGSYITGPFGDGGEIRGGCNYFVGGQRGNRFTVDAAWVDESPAEQNRTGYVAGGSGGLFRMQWWHFF